MSIFHQDITFKSLRGIFVKGTNLYFLVLDLRGTFVWVVFPGTAWDLSKALRKDLVVLHWIWSLSWSDFLIWESWEGWEWESFIFELNKSWLLYI